MIHIQMDSQEVDVSKKKIDISLDDFERIETDTTYYVDECDNVNTIEVEGEVSEFQKSFTIVVDKGVNGMRWSEIKQDKDVPSEADVIYTIHDKKLDYTYTIHDCEYLKYKAVWNELESFMFTKIAEIKEAEGLI